MKEKFKKLKLKLENLKKAFKRLLERFRKSQATPVAPDPVKPVEKAPVQPEGPPQDPTPVPTAPAQPVTGTSNPMLDAYAHSNTAPANPVIEPVAGPQADRSGFFLGWSVGNPKVNNFLSGKPYEFTVTVPDGYIGGFEVIWAEVSGSPEGDVTTYITDHLGNLYAATETGAVIHGSRFVSKAPPGVYTVHVIPRFFDKPTGPFLVQLNHA